MSTPIFAVDFRRVAEAGLRTKHAATFPLRYLDHATDPSLRNSVFVRTYGREHHDGKYLPLRSREARHWLKAVRFTKQPHVQLGSAEVACGIRVDALGRLALLDSAELVCGPAIIPHYFNFYFGTCAGCIKPGATAYELLAIVNEEPGNGDFARLMQHLVALCQYHERDLLVLEVLNGRLEQHLIQHWGMQPVGATRHLFRAVAGCGTCPEEFQTAAPANAGVDELLCLVVNALGHAA